MKVVQLKYWWKIRVRSSNEGGIRSRLGWFFRRLAVLVDGKHTVTISMLASHHVPRDERVDILVQGFAHANRLYEERVRQEAVEAAMLDVCPELQEGAE